MKILPKIILLSAMIAFANFAGASSSNEKQLKYESKPAHQIVDVSSQYSFNIKTDNIVDITLPYDVKLELVVNSDLNLQIIEPKITGSNVMFVKSARQGTYDIILFISKNGGLYKVPVKFVSSN